MDERIIPNIDERPMRRVLHGPYYTGHIIWFIHVTYNMSRIYDVSKIWRKMNSLTISIGNPIQDKKRFGISASNRTNRPNRQRQVLLVGTDSKWGSWILFNYLIFDHLSENPWNICRNWKSWGRKAHDKVLLAT